MRVRHKGTAIERYSWLIAQEKTQKNFKEEWHTLPSPPLYDPWYYKIAFPMNGFFIGRKFICVKSRVFTLKKNLFTDVYFHKKADFLQLFNCIKAGFLHKKAVFSKNIFSFLQLV